MTNFRIKRGRQNLDATISIQPSVKWACVDCSWSYRLIYSLSSNEYSRVSCWVHAWYVCTCITVPLLCTCVWCGWENISTRILCRRGWIHVTWFVFYELRQSWTYKTHIWIAKSNLNCLPSTVVPWQRTGASIRRRESVHPDRPVVNFVRRKKKSWEKTRPRSHFIRLFSLYPSFLGSVRTWMQKPSLAWHSVKVNP